MSQMKQPKSQLDVLQGMVNAVLIETGKVLRSAQKDGRPTPAAAARIKSTMPNFGDAFHQALDELECDILRAKAVIYRDYEELRSKRLALENPEPIFQEAEPQIIETSQVETNGSASHDIPETSEPRDIIKQSSSPEKQDIPDSQSMLTEDTQASAALKAQNPTPPSSGNVNGTDSKPIGLGIVTDGTVDAPGPATAELQNSSIDSLFGPDDHNGDDAALDFDSMDFLQDTSTNTQANDQSQQSNDFDLASFGNANQDFSMPDMQTSTNNGNNTANATDTKPSDDPFASLGNVSTDNTDIDLSDLGGMAGGDDSVFDDIYFGDDPNNLAGGEMEHGEFDDAFFGLE